MDKATTEMDRAVQSLMKDWGDLQKACEAAGADKTDAATMLLIELRAIRELLHAAKDGGTAVRVMPIGADEFGLPIFPSEECAVAGQSLPQQTACAGRKS